MSTHLHAEDPASALRIAGREALVDQRSDASSGDDFDALTDLFLGGEGARNAPTEPGGDNSPDPPQPDSPSHSAAPPAQPALRLARDAPHGESEAAAVADKPVAAATSVEALILSHLPVTSGPWAAQYAAALSQARGRPVALLALLADRTSLRLFGAPRQESFETAEESEDSLDAAIAKASAFDPLWLMRSDALREADILALDAITGVTILTSADEAATIAAYRVIKGVQTALEPRAGARLSIRLGVVGADQDRAAAAHSSLSRAAKTFLDCPLEAGLTVSSMTPTRSAALYDAESTHDPPAALALVKRASQRISRADDAEPGSAAGADRSLETGAMRPESLARLLDPPLSPLSIRCPHEKQIELAVDHADALRLLARKSPRAFEAAAIVRAWAGQHRELLELAVRRSLADVERAPLHIFVESARDARRLVDAACCVHLLVRRNVKGEETHFAIDL